MATLERAIVVGSESWTVIDCAPGSIKLGYSEIEGQMFRFYRWPDDEFGIPAGTLFLLSPLQDPTSGYGLRNMELAWHAADLSDPDMCRFRKRAQEEQRRTGEPVLWTPDPNVD